MTFAMNLGPLIWSIVAFRNSLVYHSLDKMTSHFLHWFPACVSYATRWHPRAVMLDHLTQDAAARLEWESASFTSLFLLPLLPYLAWVVLYYLKVWVGGWGDEGGMLVWRWGGGAGGAKGSGTHQRCRCPGRVRGGARQDDSCRIGPTQAVRPPHPRCLSSATAGSSSGDTRRCSSAVLPCALGGDTAGPSGDARLWECLVPPQTWGPDRPIPRSHANSNVSGLRPRAKSRCSERWSCASRASCSRWCTC